MAVNKVVFGAVAIMDISDSTVTPETLAKDAVAYAADGERIVGTHEEQDVTTPLAELNAANGGEAAATIGAAVDNTEALTGEQTDLIAQIETALEGKAAGGSGGQLGPEWIDITNGIDFTYSEDSGIGSIVVYIDFEKSPNGEYIYEDNIIVLMSEMDDGNIAYFEGSINIGGSITVFSQFALEFDISGSAQVIDICGYFGLTNLGYCYVVSPYVNAEGLTIHATRA